MHSEMRLAVSNREAHERQNNIIIIKTTIKWK